MKKLIIFLGIILTSCVNDVNDPSYWVRNHSEKITGNFISYSINTGDTLFVQFIPSYWDSIADQSINIILISTLSEPQAYKFEEVIESGISNFRISRCDLQWDRENNKWCYLEWVLYDVVSHDIENGTVTHMWTSRQGSQDTYIFEKL